MTDTPTRFPLAWPTGRQRKKHRIRGQFSQAKDGGSGQRPISIATATERLEDQLQRLGGTLPILSSNLELRLDGRPRADRGAPADPGVCLYFQMKGQPYAMACDTFNEVAQNIAAIANHIEATRRIERYGVATAAETLQAFSALPPPMVTPPPVDWRKVFGLAPGAVMTGEEISALYRIKAKARAHDEAALQELNVARDLAFADTTTLDRAKLGAS